MKIAKCTVAVAVSGGNFVIHAGTAYADDNPAVIAHPQHFAPADDLDVEPVRTPQPIEAATAAPGERRSTRRSTRKSAGRKATK